MILIFGRYTITICKLLHKIYSNYLFGCEGYKVCKIGIPSFSNSSAYGCFIIKFYDCVCVWNVDRYLNWRYLFCRGLVIIIHELTIKRFER